MEEQKKILIVDDEEVIRDFLSEVLKDSYAISTATDGDEAIELIKQQSFDLIITDMKMPKVTGEEVVKFAKENSPNSKVIIVSGYSSLYSVSESVEYGADGFISKPFSIKQLMSTLEKCLMQ